MTITTRIVLTTRAAPIVRPADGIAMVLICDCCGMRLREIGALFGGAAYTAVAQMIARTKEKDRGSRLTFKLDKLMDKCGK